MAAGRALLTDLINDVYIDRVINSNNSARGSIISNDTHSKNTPLSSKGVTEDFGRNANSFGMNVNRGINGLHNDHDSNITRTADKELQYKRK